MKRLSNVRRVATVSAMSAALLASGALANAETASTTSTTSPVPTTDATSTASTNPFSSLLSQAQNNPSATSAVSQLFTSALTPSATTDTATGVVNPLTATNPLTSALTTPHEAGVSIPQTFMYPAPTSGCSIGNSAMGITLGVAMAGPNWPLPPNIERGHVLFKAVPGFSADPTKSNIQVAWINLTNGHNGIAKLDGNIAGIPMIAKDVTTGEGQILAAMFGSIKTTDGKTCQIMIPTVGKFKA